MLTIKAEYLGDRDTGVRIHSRFLSNCDAQVTFDLFKKKSISKDKAPIFVDLYDQSKSEIIETIGISESFYSEVTGETVMSYEYYEREADFNQDLVFGAIEKVAIDSGVDIPWEESESQGLAALKLQKFRQSDQVMVEVAVDELKVKGEE